MEALKIEITIGNKTIKLEGNEETVIKQFNDIRENGLGKISSIAIQSKQGIQTQDQAEPEMEVFKDSFDEDNIISLNDVVHKDLPKSESEWVLIYGYFTSGFGKKKFTREDIWNSYKETERDGLNNRKNLSRSISSAVDNDWLSEMKENLFIVKPAGISAAQNILSGNTGHKSMKAKSSHKKEIKTTPEAIVTSKKKDIVEKKGNAKGKPGQTEILGKLLNEGFFDSKKIMGDIVEHCQTNFAVNYKSTDISPYLTKYVREEKLKREKNAETSQYEYFKS